MTRRRFFTLIALLITVANPPARIFAQTDEKSAVEATVRVFEQSVQEFNFGKANSLLAPDARLDRGGFGWNER